MRVSKLVDRRAVLLRSSEDSSTKLLGVPKLLSGTGKGKLPTLLKDSLVVVGS